MYAFLERFIVNATPAWRVLLAVWLSTPFFLLVLAMCGAALWDPHVRASLHVNVLLVCMLAFALATVANMWLHRGLWPQRDAPDPVPVQTLVSIEAIGLSFAVMAVALGLLTTGASVILLGVLAAGIWLFERRPMAIAHHSVNFVFISYDVGVLLGWWPYAPGVSPRTYADPQAAWWISLVKELLFFCGWTTLLTLLWAFIGSLESTTEQLAHESNTDALTGLANRRRFMDVMEAEIARQARTQEPMCLVLLDADHFKRVNDEHGHAEGDKVLTALAQVLSRCAPRPTGLAGRLGGEEFGLLLPDTRADQALMVCRRIQQQVAGMAFGADGRRFGITLSMGVVESTGLPLEELFKRADEQLYRAKSGGRDLVCVQEEALENA